MSDFANFVQAAKNLDVRAATCSLDALTPFFQYHSKGASCPFCAFRELFDRNTKGPLHSPRGDHGVIALLLAAQMIRTGDLQ